MQIKKNFDVKIAVVYPYLTKNISEKDSERISRSTLFKYEAQDSISTPQLASESTSPEVTKKDSTKKLVERLKNLHNDFNQMKKLAEKGLSEVVYYYNLESVEDESIADAEEGIFGVADGKVTFEEYKKAIELKKIIQEEIQRRAMLEGGQRGAA